MSAAAHDALARLRAVIENAKQTKQRDELIAYLDGDFLTDVAILANLAATAPLVRSLMLIRGFGSIAKNILADLKAHRIRRDKPQDDDNVVDMDGQPFDGPDGLDVPGLPGGTPMPPGYLITAQGLIRRDGDDAILISRQVICPIAVHRDTASNHYHVVMTWQTASRDTWERRTVARGVVSESKRIVQLSEFGAPVDSVNASEIVRWCTAVQQYCDLPESQASSVLGWQDDGARGFLWGKTCLGGSVHLLADDGTEQLAEGFRKAGSFEGWRKAWEEIAGHPAVGLAVYAAIAPALIGIIREAPTFTVDWSGRQQGGKTTLLQLAASVWGDPAALISQWRASSVGVERTLEFFRHLPTILDDTKHANPPTVVTETLYQVTGRRGRVRGKVEGMRRTADLRTVLLSTGERAATTFTEDAGARSRCLAVEGMPFGRAAGGRATSERVQVAVMDHHGHLGPAVSDYLLTKRETWPDIAARWNQHRDNIAAMSIGSDGRGSAYLATLLLSGLVIQEAVGIEFRPSIMVEAERWAAAAAKSADRPLEALRWVWSWLDQHPRSVARPADGSPFGPCSCSGSELIAVCPDERPPGVIWAALVRDMARDGFAIADVEREWIARGWVEEERSKMSANGHRLWVRSFTAAAVEAVER